jgi:hypothetical protein
LLSVKQTSSANMVETDPNGTCFFWVSDPIAVAFKNKIYTREFALIQKGTINPRPEEESWPLSDEELNWITFDADFVYYNDINKPRLLGMIRDGKLFFRNLRKINSSISLTFQYGSEALFRIGGVECPEFVLTCRTDSLYSQLFESIIADKFSKMLGLPSTLRIPPCETKTIWVRDHLVAVQEPDKTWKTIRQAEHMCDEIDGLWVSNHLIFVGKKIYPYDPSWDKDDSDHGTKTLPIARFFLTGNSRMLPFDLRIDDQLLVADFQEKICPLRMRFVERDETAPHGLVYVVDEERKEEITMPINPDIPRTLLKIFNHLIDPIGAIEDSREVVTGYPIVGSKYDVTLFSQTHQTIRGWDQDPESDDRYVYDRATHEFFAKKKDEGVFVLEQEFAVLEISKIPREQLAQILQEYLVDDLVGLLLEFMMHTTSEEFLVDPEQFDMQLLPVAKKIDSTVGTLQEQLELQF